MKKPLHFLLTACAAFMLQQQSNAQATLISNNTNLTSGFVLPGTNKPIILDDDGGFWTTDGTTATKITTAVTNPDDAGAALFNNLVYFGGQDATTNDIELWATDGTSAGTKLIKNISAGGSSAPTDFFVFNNTLYFTADDGEHGRELWKSNGQVGNATLVKDIDNGGASSMSDDFNSFFQNGNNAYFSATAGGKTGLYKIDNSGNVSLVKNIDGDISVLFTDCAALGSKTVFTVRAGSFPLGTVQLWVTDGSTNGTVMLVDFGAGSGFLSPQLTFYKNALYFQGFAADSGLELWRTDGTPANTKLFKDLDPSPGGSSAPALFLAALINGKLYFGATTEAEGNELWVTDGTESGTKIFKNINTKDGGKGDANPFFLLNMGAFANQTSGNNNINYQQAVSTSYNGRWYFIADDGVHGQELWSTDGTSDGTKMVKDINPGDDDGTELSTGAYYTTTGIYFVGNDGNSGAEPFVTDGTEGGTKVAANLNTKSETGSDPEYLFVYNGQIYLNANNGDNNDKTDLFKLNQSVVLPVKLLSFNVALQKESVGVSWTTASEVNTKNFVVERSADGIHFEALGTVTAAGNSNTTRKYQFTDVSALQTGSAFLYYRLRIVDNDERISYSGILSLQMNGGMFKLRLSPNPVHDQLTVVFSSNNAKEATLKVTDANGKVVYQQQFQTNGASSMQRNIDVSRYAAGLYYVQIITGKNTQTGTIFKQ